MSLKLEVGKSYRTRDGRKADIFSADESRYPFNFRLPGGRVESCTEAGQVSRQRLSGYDLVAPWDEPAAEPVAPVHDSVNHPAHYNASGIECIDAIRAALTHEEFRGFCKGNAIKYAWREKLKGGNEDLKKANWYLGHITGDAK